MQHLRSLFIGLSLSLLCFAAKAAEGVYDIEMVIFEQPAGSDTENFPERVELPDLSKAVDSLNSPSNGKTLPIDITSLPTRQGRLGPTVYTLNRKGAHVVAHLRWRQEIPRNQDNPWYRVRGAQLDGLIRLNRGRYIHLDTDLALNQTEHTYRIQEHARARSGELHYVDHPKLGILFQADRWVDPNATLEPVPEETLPAQSGSESPREDNPPEERAPAGELPRALPDNS